MKRLVAQAARAVAPVTISTRVAPAYSRAVGSGVIRDSQNSESGHAIAGATVKPMATPSTPKVEPTTMQTILMQVVTIVYTNSWRPRPRARYTQ